MITKQDCASERNNCVVRAYACATNTPYELSRRICAAAGRKDGAGMFTKDWVPLYAQAGYTLVDVSSIHKGATVTSVCRTFNQHATYLVLIKGHVACYKLGEYQDWLDDTRRHRVLKVWQVVHGKFD